MGEGSIEKTVLQMLWHVKEANALFQSKDFDGDGMSECIGTIILLYSYHCLVCHKYDVKTCSLLPDFFVPGFTVSEITVFQTKESAVNLLTGEYSVPEDFLKRFSRYNFDGFCLGILFTNR